MLLLLLAFKLFKLVFYYSTGFFTYLESKVLVASLVFTILVILGLIARLIYLGRKSKPQTEKSGGLDVSDAGKLMGI